MPSLSRSRSGITFGSFAKRAKWYLLNSNPCSPTFGGASATENAGASASRKTKRRYRAATCYTVVMDASLSRITIDPAICHGKPCVRGLRYPVETLLELLSSGMTVDEVLADYEDLEREDLLAVLAFAARLSQTNGLQPVGP